METIKVKAAENDLRFPIGKFNKNVEITAEMRREFIQTIADLPKKLAKVVENLSEEQLDTPYRLEGWTVRQTVHHVGDSHLNSLCRFKLALTEDTPTIRPYAEDLWAELSDSKLPIDVSLKMLEAIHLRWSTLLDSMTDEDFGRKLIHPDSGEFTLEQMLALYDWHSRHHTAHITSLIERSGW
jgi:uncharacterized damage-inducible protein DinB